MIVGALLSILATVAAFHVFPEFNVLNGRSIVARFRFSGWLIAAIFALIAFPLYAVSIKRRHDRGSGGLDVKLCLLLNGLLLVGQAAGTQWVISYAGIGYAMKEVPSIPNLIVPTPSLAVQYASTLISAFTVAMIVPLGLLGSKEGLSDETVAQGQATGRERRTRGVVLAVLCLFVVAAVAGLSGFFVARYKSEDLTIGKPVPGAIAALLDTLPSGQEGRAGALIVRPTATFANRRAKYCRSFSIEDAITTVAVACRKSGRWNVTFAASAPSGRDMEESRAAHLKSIGATIPFSHEGEALTLGF